jgi:OmpA-OmpF porin, OOP family
MTARVLVAVLVSCMVTSAPVSDAEAQGMLDRMRKAAGRGAERAAEREAERRADEAMTSVIECALGDDACVARARTEKREVRIVNPAAAASSDGARPEPANSSPATAPTTGGTSGPTDVSQMPGEGAWANYDFIPGERVLFSEDFTSDRVGNFPGRFEFIEGTVEIVEFQGRRLLRSTGRSRFSLQLPEVLPQRFTMEFDAYLPQTWSKLHVAFDEPQGGFSAIRPAYQKISPYERSWVTVSWQFQTGVDAHQEPRSLLRDERVSREVVPIRVMADGKYVKVFVNERRVANIPNADLGRSRGIGFIVDTDSAGNTVFLGNLRVAAGGQSLTDALRADGRAVTQGIYFDTSSSTLRPESTPTLQEIATLLKQDVSIRMRVEGHTDAAGDASANLALSTRRAEAVVQYLTQEGIAASRLESAGMGQSRPLEDNTTPEGRQANRRVELVIIR